MRPLSIAVHNWLSYGPAELLPDGIFKPTINFEAFELACITGPNGHGKSAAVVDALRYALFGKARHSGSRELDQADLKRKGADEAVVQLRFEVQGQTYIVTRSIGRRGQATAELTLSDGSAISGVREVDGKLKEILGGLDDVAFMASCVVGQGDATQFMQRSPGERKDILYTVLGLGALTERSDAARRRASHFESEAQKAEAQISLLTTQTAGLDQVKTDRAAKQAEMDKVTLRLEETTAHRQEAENRKGILLEAQAKCSVLLSQAQEYRNKLKDLRKERQRCRLDASDRGTKNRASEIEAAHRSYVEASKNEQLYSDAKEKLAPKLSRISQLTVLINSSRQALIKEQEGLLTRGIDSARAQQSVDDAQTSLDLLKQEQARLQKLCEEAEDNAKKANSTRDQANQSLENERREYKSFQQRLQNLNEQVTAGEAACPLCGQDLTAEHAEGVKKDLQTAVDRVVETIASLEGRLRGLPSPGELTKQVDSARLQLRKHSSKLEEAQLFLLKAFQTLEDTRKNAERLGMIEEALANKSYNVAEQAELGLLKDQVKAGYDEDAHMAATRKRQELQSAEGPFQELQTVREKEHNRTQLTESIRGLHRALRRVRFDLNRIGFRHQELSDVLRCLKDIEEQSGRLEEERTKLDREVAALDADITRVEKLVKDLQETRTRHARYVNQQNLWAELAEAYGERGVQMFLTQRAIAGLKSETNERLRDWTDGQLSCEMSFDATRGLVVVLKDSRGEERKFHACSGGEQFRVALSIRIALSRLMANRIGVKPRILIIDEGFGTQDEDGIDGLERTLKTLVGAFSNIIVITHIEAMQKRFDYHITVTKTGSGSQLWQPSL